MSNDMDIVISHKDLKNGKNIIPGLCKRLTAQLYRKGQFSRMRFPANDSLFVLIAGLVTHVMRTST